MKRKSVSDSNLHYHHYHPDHHHITIIKMIVITITPFYLMIYDDDDAHHNFEKPSQTCRVLNGVCDCNSVRSKARSAKSPIIYSSIGGGEEGKYEIDNRGKYGRNYSWYCIVI